MYRYFTSTIFLTSLLFSISTLNAATVSWQSSTQSAPWVDKGTLTTTAWDNVTTNYISVDEKTTYQEMFGWGGCFNEKGWKALMTLSQSTRDTVMKLLFDSLNGCNFSVCRVPIGSSDYAWPFYSLDETAGDYTMTNFSIARDQQYLIPYMKAATAVRPNLKIWGSPWSVPTWLKTANSGFTGGAIVENSQNFTALALYFAKAVNAYQQQGLHYFAIFPTNEPNWTVSGGYPVTGWSAQQYQDFIKNYLGPKFKADDVPAEIYLGTVLNDGDDNNKPLTANVWSDSVAYSYCSGAGYQYNMETVTRQAYPDKCFFETETPCGTLPSGGVNNTAVCWSYAIGNDDNMRTFLTGGVSVYSQWNIVLDTSGGSYQTSGPWRQYAMVMIDTIGKKVNYMPQFYQVRHYKYVKTGAYLIASSGNANLNFIAFRNLDGENILVVTNRNGSSATVAINFNGQKITPTIPGSSFNTFRCPGTPIPPTSPYSKVEAEKFSLQSGILVRPCSDGGSGVTLVGNNDWTCYHYVDFGSGALTFEARVSGVAGGSIEVHLDSSNSPVSGTCTVPASSAWSKVSCPVTGVSGIHNLYLKYKGTGTGNLFDFNWFDFTPGTSVVRMTQQSPTMENHQQIVVCNGSTLSIPDAAGKKSGSIAVYNLSGKLVYSKQFDGTAKSTSMNFGLKRGLYIIKDDLK